MAGRADDSTQQTNQLSFEDRVKQSLESNFIGYVRGYRPANLPVIAGVPHNGFRSIRVMYEFCMETLENPEPDPEENTGSLSTSPGEQFVGVLCHSLRVERAWVVQNLADRDAVLRQYAIVRYMDVMPKCLAELERLDQAAFLSPLKSDFSEGIAYLIAALTPEDLAQAEYRVVADLLVPLCTSRALLRTVFSCSTPVTVTDLVALLVDKAPQLVTQEVVDHIRAQCQAQTTTHLNPIQEQLLQMLDGILELKLAKTSACALVLAMRRGLVVKKEVLQAFNESEIRLLKSALPATWASASNDHERSLHAKINGITLEDNGNTSDVLRFQDRCLPVQPQTYKQLKFSRAEIDCLRLFLAGFTGENQDDVKALANKLPRPSLSLPSELLSHRQNSVLSSFRGWWRC